MDSFASQLVSVKEKIDKFSVEYYGIKESLLDDITPELLELSEDSFKILSLLNKSNKIFSLIKFKFFLKGLNYNDVAEHDFNKLIKYIDDPQKSEFITNMFDKILQANSKLVCSVMGLLVSDMISNNKQVSQKELIILQLLSNMNDYDITNFMYMMKFKENRKRQSSTISGKMMKYCENKNNVTSQELNLTILVLLKYGLVDKHCEVDLDMDEDYVDFSRAEYKENLYFTKISKYLFNIAQPIMSFL